MNKLDKQYTYLLQDILDNGVTKSDRTGTGTMSVFGRQIRHKMSEGFPVITTKKMPFKTIVTELLWFLQGRTDLRYLLENNCHIWTGDAYKAYRENYMKENPAFSAPYPKMLTEKEFEDCILSDDAFDKQWGDLGSIYGKQWRSWKYIQKVIGSDPVWKHSFHYEEKYIDQIANLINDLKTNPDSRRLMVNSWNVGELDQMVLPPCHYGFQVYTRELSETDGLKKINLVVKYKGNNCKIINCHNANPELLILETPEGERIIYENQLDEPIDYSKFPTRAISLMWNQRSVDTFLGLPFNIASYGLLLEILAREVNMVPDELIGNLGDVHLYSNHIEQAKEQIGREFTREEIQEHLMQSGMDAMMDKPRMEYVSKLPKRTREPYPLPTINLNKFKTDEFWKSLSEDLSLLNHLNNYDFELDNYQSHSTIKALLSN